MSAPESRLGLRLRDVDDTGVGVKPEVLAEATDLLGARRILDGVVALGDREEPGTVELPPAPR
jgi:hypothetical protein